MEIPHIAPAVCDHCGQDIYALPLYGGEPVEVTGWTWRHANTNKTLCPPTHATPTDTEATSLAAVLDKRAGNDEAWLAGQEGP